MSGTPLPSSSQTIFRSSIPIFDIRNRVATPLLPDAWSHCLSSFNLSSSFPLLPSNIRHGFLIGFPPPLLQTSIARNHGSVDLKPEVVDQYIVEELVAGRVSGPFTPDELEAVFGGPFKSSPLGLVEKAGSPGEFRIIRDLSFAGDAGVSVNDGLDSDDFPTSWGTFQDVAQFVSTVILSLLHFVARDQRPCSSVIRMLFFDTASVALPDG